MGNRKNIIVCQGTGCVSSGSIPTYQALGAEIKKAKLAGIATAYVDDQAAFDTCGLQNPGSLLLGALRSDGRQHYRAYDRDNEN